jgi:hypothetical protein
LHVRLGSIVLFGRRTKFFRTADAFHARRREGPNRFAQTQPRIPVMVLKSRAAAERENNRPSRDFWSRSIFDFFNSIGQTRKSAVEIVRSGLPLKADSSRTSRHVGFVPQTEVADQFYYPHGRLPAVMAAGSATRGRSKSQVKKCAERAGSSPIPI